MNGTEEDKLILFVDDDADIRYAVTELLEMEKYKCVAVSNGVDAMLLLEAGLKPCLIITDIMMPIMDGFELIERISILAHLKNVPIVCATASTTIRLRLPSDVLCIAKPFDLDRLLKLIEDVTNKGDLCEEIQS